MPTTENIADRFDPGHVLEAKTGGYLVKSRTATGVWWFVTGDSCSCHAGRDDKRCWHVSQVTAFCRALDKSMARPTPPPNISALVD